MTRKVIISLMLAITVFLVIVTSFSFESIAKDNTEEIYVCTPCNRECDSVDYYEGGNCNSCNMSLLLKTDQVKTKRIAFYLQNGVEILDFAGPMEVFVYAGYEVFTVSKNKNPIISQGVLKIIPDYSIEDAPSADILAFFGGNYNGVYRDSEVIDWVKSQRDIEYYFSVCTGAFILAESGILQDKTATTFHDAVDKLERNYPDINVLKNVRFVDNGNIITTAGISAGIDGALHLVAKLNGFNMARKTAYYMEYDKWIPGEGLLFTRGNPYKDYTNVDRLKAYTGTYEYLNNSEIMIDINKNEKSLFVIIGNRKYPLLYNKNDSISSLNGDEFIFERNEDLSITGFKTGINEDKIFKKLN